MRAALWVVLVFAACAPSESGRKSAAADSGAATAPAAAATSAPAFSGPAAGLVGRWDGRTYRSAKDTGIAYSAVRRAEGGAVVSTVTPSAGPTLVFKTSSLTDSTFVQETSSRYDSTYKTDVITYSEGHFFGDSMSGTTEVRAAKGGKVLNKTTFKAKRVAVRP